MAMFSLSKLSYPRRLFLWLLTYSVLLVGSFVGFQYHREKEFKADEINSQLQLVNMYILKELSRGCDVSQVSLKDFHPFDDIRVSVISDKGEIIYDNALDSLPHTNHLDREEIKKAIAHGSGYAVRRHSQSTGDSYFYSAQKDDNGHIVRTAVPYSVSLSSLLQTDYTFLWIMGLISAIMCFLGFLATRRVGQHITRLKDFARNVESGIKISDTEPFPHDELGEISNHIVRLYARLQQANADRDNEHRAAIHLQQEKERIKKQLTNNINHELKTPVASIQLCVETMLAHRDMSEEKQQQFLQRCLSHTERLKRLLADVSLITRMDEGGRAIVKEHLDLGEIVRDVLADKELPAKHKGMTIVNEIVENLEITGNRPLLESIFGNLVDNSIAYSGGSRIWIKLVGADDEKIVISFADDGTGVSDEHLTRIFERFYRIDKGRSRAAGGTGLGLSIVKNAVLFHGGVISAENLDSGGLAFRIELPRREGISQ